MIEKVFRALFNIIRIMIIRIRFGRHVIIPMIQPMRIQSQLMIQKSSKVHIGKNFRLETHSKVRVISGGRLVIGDNCFINCNSYITAMGDTKIGDNCMIGPGVMIFDHNHDYKNEFGISAGKIEKGNIEIGNGVWIGANCVILKGAVIGDHAVIAAGSIVNGYVPPHVVFVQKRQTEYYSYGF